MAVTGIIQEQAWDPRAPIVEHGDELSRFDRGAGRPFRDVSDAEPRGGSLGHQVHMVERQAPWDVDRDFLPAPGELPSEKLAARQSEPDAGVVFEIVGCLW